MHSETMNGCGGEGPLRKIDWCRKHRQIRRWCALGFVMIPLVFGFLWLQFAAARETGELFYADHVCGCRDVVTSWVSDYVWTQLVWLPCNMLFLLIWVALAVKLWGGKRRFT
ncbi:hypothetical protein [Herbaspirillum sp. LeCh32-8]|uniref:hypothetical protein n=1 Tax=Herbaspirillum sp. LeCh32-8 TaxID=2821356 RepID=UPI001FD77E04|nr:hypothetical protein [Herbaspirillum sp. LeCh32-8]